MYLVCLCVLLLGVTSNVFSQENDIPNQRWDRDPVVQDIARELSKFLTEYIEKNCNKSMARMNAEKYDEHPVYVKPSMQSTEPEEETLVLRRSFITRLEPDYELTNEPGDRRAVASTAEETPSSEEDNDGLLLEIEDQPKDSKSVLTADELVLSINEPGGTRRSSITLPSDLRQIISDYLRQRRRRRKVFNVSLVENSQVRLSGGSNTNAVLYRRADEPSSANEDIDVSLGDDARVVRRFFRNPHKKSKSGKLFNLGFKVGMLPGDKIKYKKSKPMQMQMGMKKFPGFSKNIQLGYSPGMNTKQSSFPSGSFNFGIGIKPPIKKFEITGQPSKPYDSFKLSTENKPYDVKIPYNVNQFEISGQGNPPQSQYSIQQIPGDNIPGQDNSPYGFPKLSMENKPYDTKMYQYDTPGQGSPGQMKSPYGSMKFSIGWPKKPYGPDVGQNYNPGSFKLPTDDKPYDHEVPYSIQQYDIPGQIQFGMPGQASMPHDSSKLPDRNKPFDTKVPELSIEGPKKPYGPDVTYNMQQYEMPGQNYNPGSFKLPTDDKPYDHEVPYSVQQYDIPGQIQFGMPGQASMPHDSFWLPDGNKPYDSNVPRVSFTYSKPATQFMGPPVYGIQQIPRQNSPAQIKYAFPGQKFEIPGSYTPGQTNAAYDPLKLSTGNKPDDANNPYDSLKLSIDSIRPPYAPDITYDVAQYEPSRQKNSNPMEIGLPQFNVKPRYSKYQYSIPREDFGINFEHKTIGLHPSPVEVGPRSQPFEIGLHSQSVEVGYRPGSVGYTQYKPGDIYSSNVANSPGSYSLTPTFAEMFRRKIQVINDTVPDKQEYENGVQQEPQENPPAQPINKDLQQELLRRALSQIEKEFDEDMEQSHALQLPAKTPEKQKEENDDNKNEQEHTEVPQTETPYRRGGLESDIKMPMNQPGTVQLAEPAKNPTNSSEEGYVFGISSESADEEATLPNTYTEKNKVNDEGTALSDRHKCDDTSEMDYEDDDQNAKESTLKPDAQKKRRTYDNPKLKLALEKLQEFIDKQNETQVEEDDKPQLNVIEMNMTEVRRFSDSPDSFNGSINLEDFVPHGSTPKYLTNSSEINDDNLPIQNEDGPSNNGLFAVNIGKLFPPANTSYDGVMDNITMFISETIVEDGEDTNSNALPVNRNTEGTILNPTEKYLNIEEPIHDMTPPPMERTVTELFDPVTNPQDENIDDNLDTDDVLPQETMPEEVYDPILIQSPDEGLPELQTETYVYTDGVENPIEADTVQFDHVIPSTFEPEMVEEYSVSAAPVTFIDSPSITTDEVTYVDTTEAIEPGVDMTLPPPVTIADMGKDIDYLQYYGTEDPGHEAGFTEMTTVPTNLEFTTLNLIDNPTATEITPLNYEDTENVHEPVSEVNQRVVEGQTVAPQRRNKQSEESVEDTSTDPSFQNGLPFLKNKLMAEYDGNYENYILEDILQKPFDDLTEKEKIIYERMVYLVKHPDNGAFDSLPDNYRPLNSTDDQFLLRGLLNDTILDKDYLRKGVILLKNYPFEKDVETLKIRTALMGILRDFKTEPNATTSEDKRMNLVLSHLTSHPKELDRVYEAMVKKGGEPDTNELAVIEQWLRLLKYNKGIELMYLFDNKGGGPENDFRTFLIQHLMKKDPVGLSAEEHHLLDTLVLIYINNLMTRPVKAEQDIVEDDLYKVGILTMHNNPNHDNLGLLSNELLESVFKKPDTELNNREYKIYNYLMKLAKNPDELSKRYYDVLGTVKNDLDEMCVELNNGSIPTSFEVMSATLNDILTKKLPEDFTMHDDYILFLLQYLSVNKELIPHLSNFEQEMIYNQSLFKFGIITMCNSPNRNETDLLEKEILQTVMKKPQKELNVKEKMIYKYLMRVPMNHAYLMETYNSIMNALKDSAPENDNKTETRNKYMVAIIKIPIKSRDKNGDVITNKTIKISMDDYHPIISNLAGEPVDNEKAVFIMPEENGESLSPLNLDDKTKLVHKLEVTRASLKVHRAHPSEYVEEIPKHLDDLVPDLVRLLQSDSAEALNESGEINYDVTDNSNGNLQQLLGHAILLIRRRKINQTEVDDGELIQYLTTLQRNLMTEIKSEYGTTDFKQKPVEIERRYMAWKRDGLEDNKPQDAQDAEQPSSGAIPLGHGRSMTDIPVQIAINTAQYRKNVPDQYTPNGPQEQRYQNQMAVPTANRRGLMDTPVQIAMNAVAKWFMAQNLQQPPYRKNVPYQYTPNYPQEQRYQNQMAVPTAHRRGMMKTPVKIALKAVAKWFMAQTQQEPSYRRNVPDQKTTDYPQEQRYENQMAVPTAHRRGMMKTPVKIALNAVAKWFMAQNQQQPSYRRNVPDQKTTDFPIEQTTQKTVIIEPGRRYASYYDDSLDDYLYEDPIGYFRRSNIEKDDKEEEKAETTIEKVGGVISNANRRSSKSPNPPTLKIQKNKDRRNRKDKPINVKHGGDSKVWNMKGLKRRSDTSNQEPDEDGKMKLIPMRRDAIPLENEGDNKEEDKVERKRKHGAHRRRGKHGRNSRRRKAGQKSRKPKTVIKLNLEFEPETDDVENTTSIIPSRRQNLQNNMAYLMPSFDAEGTRDLASGYGPLFRPPGRLNSMKMLDMRRSLAKNPDEQVQSSTGIGEQNVGPVTQTIEFVPTTQQANVENTTTLFVPSRRQFPLNFVSGLLPFGGGGGGGGGPGGFNPLGMLGGLNPFQMLGMRRNEDKSPAAPVQPATVLGEDYVAPGQAGHMNYIPPAPQAGYKNYIPQNNIQTYTDGNMPPDYLTTAVPANANVGPVPQAGQVNYDSQNNAQVQSIDNVPASAGSVEPSQKNRRSADSTSLLRMLNPVEIFRRMNPFITKEEKPAVESTENSTKHEENVTSQYKPGEEQEYIQPQRRGFELEVEKNLTENVDNTKPAVEINDTTEHNLQASTNKEENVTSQYKPGEEQEYIQPQRRGFELEVEKNLTDNVETTKHADEINDTTEHILQTSTNKEENVTVPEEQEYNQPQRRGFELEVEKNITENVETTKPADEITETSTNQEENVTSQYKPGEEQEYILPQRRGIELEDEKNITENVETTKPADEITETSTNQGDNVTSQYVPKEQQEYNQPQRAGLELEVEKNITDTVENTTKQEINNTTEDNPQEENMTTVQEQQVTTELAREHEQEQGSVVETTEYHDPAGTGSHPEGDTTSTTQLRSGTTESTTIIS